MNNDPARNKTKLLLWAALLVHTSLHVFNAEFEDTDTCSLFGNTFPEVSFNYHSRNHMNRYCLDNYHRKSR